MTPSADLQAQPTGLRQRFPAVADEIGCRGGIVAPKELDVIET
jgi:hypothetical protein